MRERVAIRLNRKVKDFSKEFKGDRSGKLGKKESLHTFWMVRVPIMLRVLKGSNGMSSVPQKD